MPRELRIMKGSNKLSKGRREKRVMPRGTVAVRIFFPRLTLLLALFGISVMLGSPHRGLGERVISVDRALESSPFYSTEDFPMLEFRFTEGALQ